MERYGLNTYPRIDLRVAPEVDLDELAELLPGAGPGDAVGVPLPAALTATHLAVDLLAPNPMVESMLRRFLTAVTARIGGLDTRVAPPAWPERIEKVLRIGKLPKRDIEEYFHLHGSRMQLRGEWPLLQDPRLREECTRRAPPGKLVMDRASGNTQVWRPHTPESEPVPLAEAFGWLLAWQGFGPSGMGAQRRHSSVDSKNMVSGCLRCSVSYHPLAGTLFDSLVLGCPPPELWPDPVGADLAPWEQTVLPDPLLPRAVEGPVTLLTGRSTHAVLLDIDGDLVTGCWVAWGTRAAAPVVRDPFVVQGPKAYRRADHRRHLLRDFDALVHARTPADTGLKKEQMPAWLGVMADMPADLIDRLGQVRVRALGMHQEKQEGGEEHWFAQTTPASVAEFLPTHHPERADRIKELSTEVDEAGKGMRKALTMAWAEIAPGSSGANPWIDRADHEFWDRCDRLFWDAVAQPEGPAPDFARLALDVYDTSTRSHADRPPGLTAIARRREPLASAVRPAPKEGSLR
ncbi:type I-E CRISPR-associated protein Cse1/CasA [Kitasatospora cineracea]|uniref:type I-E CRISPR-associated protein Cse1/CasA n=1 Tax=Kitasatospora cineracea TaxID=88074 RepID=UPI0036D766B4